MVVGEFTFVVVSQSFFLSLLFQSAPDRLRGRRGVRVSVYLPTAGIVHWWRKANYNKKVSFLFSTRGF